MKKSILTILALSIVLISTSSTIVLGSEEKKVNFLSNIERVESIQGKKALHEQHLTLIEKANKDLTKAEEQLNDAAIDQAQVAINEVPRLFQEKLLTKLNQVKSTKVALEEQERIEEEKKAAALAAKVEAEEQAKIVKEQQTKQLAEQSQQVVASKKNSHSNSSEIKNNIPKESSSKEKKDTDSNSSSNNSNKTNNGSVKINTENAKKVSEGDIKNHAGSGKSGSTYEEWTFDLPPDFPNW